MLITIVIVVLSMLVLILMLRPLQRRFSVQPRYLFEYLIFLRYPILCALTLILLPLIATTLLPTFIANLFIVDDWMGLAIITALGILCSWVIMFTGGLIIVGAPQRFDLRPLEQPEASETRAEASPNPSFIRRIIAPIRDPIIKFLVSLNRIIVDTVCLLWEQPRTIREDRPALKFRQFRRLWWYDFRENFNYLAILFPVLLVWSLLMNLYDQATLGFWLVVAAITAGIIIAFLVGLLVLTLQLLMLLLLQWGCAKLRDTKIWIGLQQRLDEAKLAEVDMHKIPGVREVVDSFRQGYINPNEKPYETPFTHRRAIFLFLIVGLMYGIGYTLLNPAQPNFLTYHTPPLAYFIVLITLAALILPSLSYYFDRYRVPMVFFITIIYIISYYMPGVDHYYEFTAAPTLSASSTPPIETPKEVVTAWNRHYSADQHPVMVVVTASGGGIKAAAWTAHVLGELRRDPDLGQAFAESITLVSTVSGGSVGGMYVLDQYRQPDLPLDKAVNQAGQSSLNAIAWGMAYPDLLRTMDPFNWLVDKTNDRGAAAEHAWRAQFGQEPSTLLMWPQTVEKQWQPLQVFNTTIAETGQRLLLSPIEIRSPFTITNSARAQNFITLYEGCDLSVVTAARLSATFPYVTPIARPLATETCAHGPQTRYHLADGGYYDNFGVVTAVEFLSALTPQVYKKEFNREKILLVQIRASPLEDVEARSASADGFIYASLGPGLTALQVQTATQIGRNDLELALLQQNWARDGVTIESVVFELRKEVALSWHLSAQEKQDIAQEFTEPRNQKNLARLKQFWGITNLTTASP
ncbi:MAG: patatin-like phospholipase family protein [Anaerolineae bacterium]|nr:patatin-like phospholipase family protein [Anaerolineae bacterium]